jgi:DNA-binding MarR family transcriptional regulator
MSVDGTNLILQKKPTLALLAISREKETYASLISREIGSTFAHTANILGKLEDEGLVRFETSGNDNRVKSVGLTSKGKATAVLVEKLVAVMDNTKTESKRKTINRKKVKPKKDVKEFVEKLGVINDNIDLVQKEELSSKRSISQKDFVRIGQRLGPYRRELRKIIKTGKKVEVKQAATLDKKIEDVFGERERLRGQ